MKRPHPIVAGILTFGLGACSHYYHQIDPALNGLTTYTDVKQRAVYSAWRHDDRFPWTITSQGQPVQTGRVDVLSVVNCPEPPPDALSAIARSGNAKLTTPSKIELSGGGADNESVASIGLRTQSTELLKQLSTNHCLGYQGGALNKADFQALTFDQQTSTVAIAAIEEVGGVAKAVQGQTITATATVPGDASTDKPATATTTTSPSSAVSKAEPTSGQGGANKKKKKGSGTAGGAKSQGGSESSDDANTGTPQPGAQLSSTQSPAGSSTAGDAIAKIVNATYSLGFSRDICTTIIMGVSSGDMPANNKAWDVCLEYLRVSSDRVNLSNDTQRFVNGYIQQQITSKKIIDAVTWKQLITLTALAQGGEIPSFDAPAAAPNIQNGRAGAPNGKQHQRTRPPSTLSQQKQRRMPPVGGKSNQSPTPATVPVRPSVPLGQINPLSMPPPVTR